MNTKIDLKTKTIISIVLFVVVFTGLVLIATFNDLAISKLLTKGSLGEGAYISSNGFGLFFEAIGSSPLYIMATVAATILFWFFIRKDDKRLNIIFPLGAAFVAVVAMTLCVHDVFKYVGEHLGNEEYMNSLYVYGLSLVMGGAAAGGLLLYWRNVKVETNDKLAVWALVIVGALICYLIVHFTKGPVGRMRFRAMNALGDTEYTGFTNWYVVNGARKPTAEQMATYAVASDAYKSFPSGHTYSAGLIYALICLPDVLERFNTKKWRIALWSIAIGVTGIVAISRIVVGAHYMSDVLFAGTIAFLSVLFWREIFICKFSHIKCFKKGGAASETACEEASIGQDAEVEETVAEDDDKDAKAE